MKPMVRSRPTVMRLTRDAPGRRLGFICFAPRGRITGKSGKVRDKVRAVFRVADEVSRVPERADRWAARTQFHSRRLATLRRERRHTTLGGIVISDWPCPALMISPSAL